MLSATKIKIKIFYILLSICFEIHAQRIDFKYLENIQNCSQCKGICLKYDTDGILEKKIFYSQQAKLDSIHYFDLKGQRILDFRPDYKIDSSCFDLIHTEVAQNINWGDELFDVKGGIIASFFVNSNLEILDVRILNGIHKSIDEEVKRAIQRLNKSILSCAVNETELQQVMVFIKL
jgi:hypothetical protein